MKARAKLIEGMAFLGEAGSGHSLVMDGSPEYGGRNLGFRPMELLLVGMAGCTAFDVVNILRKGRETVADCVVEVSATRAELDTLLASVPKGPVISYCNTGHTAALNWFVLSEVFGRPDVTLYDGSMTDWTQDETRPVATR